MLDWVEDFLKNGADAAEIGHGELCEGSVGLIENPWIVRQEILQRLAPAS